jgi:hypothetical protein
MTVVMDERDSHFLAVDTESVIESWPLASDASWRVVAWPNWRTGGDLSWIFREIGPALAKRNACLCLRHDPEIDGPLENAKARLDDVMRGDAVASRPRVAIINGITTEEGWSEIGESIDAKIGFRNSADSPRRAPIEGLRVVELRTGADAERLLTDKPVLKPLDQYRKLFADVPGWFRLPAISIWDSLLTLQSDADVTGNFLEIGVWMGRSALLSTLHSSESEQCVFVDPLRIEEAEARLRSVRESGLHFIQGTSRSISAPMLPGAGAPSYRWIHIDGEHSGTAVEHDVALASSILAPRGIIVIDDFFDAAYPQITFAVIEHLRAHPKSLMMFLCGYSKAYLCHPSDGRWLLKHVAEKLNDDMMERGAQPVTLFKTADPIDLNCFGIGPRVEGTAFRGPDWKTDLLEY